MKPKKAVIEGKPQVKGDEMAFAFCMRNLGKINNPCKLVICVSSLSMNKSRCQVLGDKFLFEHLSEEDVLDIAKRKFLT